MDVSDCELIIIHPMCKTIKDFSCAISRPMVAYSQRFGNYWVISKCKELSWITLATRSLTTTHLVENRTF